MTSSIQISKQTKELISSFGTKEDTYEDIIKRIYTLARKQQLHEFLTEEEAIPIDEAITRAKNRTKRTTRIT